MKISLLLITFLISNLYSNGQNTILNKHKSNLKINLILSELDNILTNEQKNIFKSKILNIITKNGISGENDFASSIILIPNFQILEIKNVETGLNNICNVSAEINLTSKHNFSNEIFSFINFTTTDFGKSKDQAIINSIQNIYSRFNVISSFIENTHFKINEYYDNSCEDIITNSNTLAKQRRFSESIAKLYSIPEETACYSKVQNIITSQYNDYLELKCLNQIKEAKSKIALRDYEKALLLLTEIESKSKCSKEADKLIMVCEKHVSEQIKRKINLENLKFKRDFDLEKSRLSNIRQITIEYIKSNRKNSTTNIFR